jgi:hypothetical protein
MGAAAGSRFRTRVVGLAVVVVLVLGYLAWYYQTRCFWDFAKVPLSRSEYLRDVVEPIAMIEGPGDWASDST